MSGHHPLAGVEFVGGFAPFGDPGMDGFATMQRQFSSAGSAPPIHHHAGITVADLERGMVRFSLSPGPRWMGTDGLLPAAASVFLCDAPLGTAVLTLLGPGLASPTAELSVFHLAPVGAPGLSATARVLRHDTRTGYAECDITDGAGTLVARATTRVAVTPVPDGLIPPPRPVPDGFIPHHLRPVPPGVGIPWHDLHGVEVVSERIGEAILRLETLGWHLSPSANLYGGTLGLLAQAATDAAAGTSAPSGAATVPYDLKVQYPRPIGPGAVLTATAKVVHAGRRTCFSEVLIHRDDEKLVTLGTATHGYHPPP